jgi:hypothetical protein
MGIFLTTVSSGYTSFCDELAAFGERQAAGSGKI